MSTSAPTGASTEAAPSCLERLHLRDFRNFRELRCEFPKAGAIIIGPNGAGKTNLLEAIYYLEIFRSFRGAPDRDLVYFGEDVFRIEAELSGGCEHTGLAAAFQRTGRRTPPGQASPPGSWGEGHYRDHPRPGSTPPAPMDPNRTHSGKPDPRTTQDDNGPVGGLGFSSLQKSNE